ncbi:hypothetical protein [Peptostreptococcus anaerobius]|uniref:hypothetical protein n=1 Tax=Peptostreptococcus anaerobius TaxID=1261 RepID=UPI00189BF842|nr:hypothetical protein [Peptostreptococcus anaerobius]MDB8851969.1 hypothetical protein [Peptostreptococcus anaerobius]
MALLLAAFTFVEFGMDPLVVDVKLAALTAVYMAVLSYLIGFRATTRDKSKRIRLALIFSLVITPIYSLIPYLIAGTKIMF